MMCLFVKWLTLGNYTLLDKAIQEQYVLNSIR